MDAMPWTAAVKQSKKLRLYIGELEGNWATVVADCITDFNALAKSHGLGVKLERATDAAYNKDGAEVLFGVGNGAVEFTHDRTTYAAEFDGSRMHGKTILAHRDKIIEKAKIFLPNQPLVAIPTGETGMRPVGNAVKKVIVLHEFLHACGLTNSQHSTEGLFQPTPAVDIGNTASGDRARRRPSSVDIKHMPPYILDDTTKAAIAKLWK